jgi:hypothetical protein
MPFVSVILWLCLFQNVVTVAQKERRNAIPNFSFDPNTSKLCAWWLDVEGLWNCQGIQDVFGVSPVDFLRWVCDNTPSIDPAVPRLTDGRTHPFLQPVARSPSTNPSVSQRAKDCAVLLSESSARQAPRARPPSLSLCQLRLPWRCPLRLSCRSQSGCPPHFLSQLQLLCRLQSRFGSPRLSRSQSLPRSQ